MINVFQGPPPNITNTYAPGQPPPGVFPNSAPNYRMPPPGNPPFIPGLVFQFKSNLFNFLINFIYS